MLVYKDPGPTVITSAVRKAFKTCGSGKHCSGSSRSFLIGARDAEICVSPCTIDPSSSSATKWTSLIVAGKMCPLLARTSDDNLTASVKSPVTSVSAARKRLPKLCPPRSPSPRNRYRNSLDKRLESSESATMQFRMSPGGSICNSSRSLPELPPLSETVTIAESVSTQIGSSVLPTNCFKPASSVDRPVPPPRATNL